MGTFRGREREGEGEKETDKEAVKSHDWVLDHCGICSVADLNSRESVQLFDERCSFRQILELNLYLQYATGGGNRVIQFLSTRSTLSPNLLSNSIAKLDLDARSRQHMDPQSLGITQAIILTLHL